MRIPRRRSTRPAPAALAPLALLLAVVAACTPGGALPPGRPPPTGAGAGAAPTPAPRIRGWLHAEGARLVDRTGAVVRLVGANVQGLGTGSGAPRQAGVDDKGWTVPSPATFANVAAWGFNSVRITIAWANIEPDPPTALADGSVLHHYNEAYLEALDGVVHGFGSRGVAVVLAMSQNKWSPAFQVPAAGGGTRPGSGMPAWLYPSPPFSQVYQGKRAFFDDATHSWAWFTEAWKAVATRYRDNPTVVAADVLNEPYYGTRWLPTPASLRLDQLYAVVGAGIRQANPRLLLIFEDSQDRGDGRFAMTGPPPLGNVAYSFHLYTGTWDPEGLARTRRYLDRARAWDVPLWIGEFDRFGSTVDGVQRAEANWEPELRAMLAFSRTEGVGWCWWGYRGKDPLATADDAVANPALLAILQAGL